MIRKFFIKVFTFLLCVGLIAAGAYLSYTQSDFEEIKKDFGVIMNEAPLFPGFELPEETPEETPEEIPEGTPEV